MKVKTYEYLRRTITSIASQIFKNKIIKTVSASAKCVITTKKRVLLFTFELVKYMDYRIHLNISEFSNIKFRISTKKKKKLMKLLLKVWLR